MRIKKILLIFPLIFLIILNTGGVNAQFNINIKQVLSQETINSITNGDKLRFEEWNQMVVSLNEKDINEVFINQLLNSYIEEHPHLLPEKVHYKSAQFNLSDQVLHITFRYGVFRIKCEAMFIIQTDTQTITVQEKGLKVLGIRIPRFISKKITGEFIPYIIYYKDITGKDSLLEINSIKFDGGRCDVSMRFPEPILIEKIKQILPYNRVSLLENKRIDHVADLTQLSNMNIFISQATVTRIFNEQLQSYIAKGDTVIPDGLTISSVDVELQDRLIMASIKYMGFPLDVQAEFLPYCEDNVIGVDIGELFINKEQLPEMIGTIMKELTQDIRLDLNKMNFPSFIKINYIAVTGSDLVINISIDIINREPLKVKNLEVLLGPGINDQNAYFEYFVPISNLEHTLDRFLTVELLQNGINNWIKGCSLPEGVDLLINENSVDVLEWDLDITLGKIHLLLSVWNIQVELDAAFSFTSDSKEVMLSFSQISVFADGKEIPRSVIVETIGDRFDFYTSFVELSEFFYMEELNITKLTLEEAGLMFQFSLK